MSFSIRSPLCVYHERGFEVSIEDGGRVEYVDGEDRQSAYLLFQDELVAVTFASATTALQARTVMSRIVAALAWVGLVVRVRESDLDLDELAHLTIPADLDRLLAIWLLDRSLPTDVGQSPGSTTEGVPSPSPACELQFAAVLSADRNEPLRLAVACEDDLGWVVREPGSVAVSTSFGSKSGYPSGMAQDAETVATAEVGGRSTLATVYVAKDDQTLSTLTVGQQSCVLRVESEGMAIVRDVELDDALVALLETVWLVPPWGVARMFCVTAGHRHDFDGLIDHPVTALSWLTERFEHPEHPEVVAETH